MDLMYLSSNETKIGSDYVRRHPNVAVPYLVVISLATLTGTAGNILVIGAVLVNKQLKTTGNTFVVNLALADLCVTAFVDPMSIIGILRGQVWFEDRPILCEAVASICLTSCFCSLLSIGAISFNRYVHICHNQKYGKVYTLRNTILMCVGLWTISVLLEIPNFLGWGDHVYDKKTLSCVWDRTADFSYTLFFSTAGVAFPVTLISVCYAKIFLHVRNSRRKVANSVTNGVKVAKESMKLARTLFIIFVVFAVSWTPYAIIVVADVNDQYHQELHIFSILIAHTNSSLNFVLYGLTNKQFRTGYVKFLHLDKCFSDHCLTRYVAHDHNSITVVPSPSRPPDTKISTVASQ